MSPLTAKANIQVTLKPWGLQTVGQRVPHVTSSGPARQASVCVGDGACCPPHQPMDSCSSFSLAQPQAMEVLVEKKSQDLAPLILRSLYCCA